MADVFSSQKRSAIMRAVHSKGTRPERQVRTILRRLHLRLRGQARDLPGTPDLVLLDRRVAIFVNGCFWHGHPNCSRATLPTTRRTFWTSKIALNRRRDRSVTRGLREQGYSVLTIWTCQLKNTTKLGLRIRAAINSSRRL